MELFGKTPLNRLVISNPNHREEKGEGITTVPVMVYVQLIAFPFLMLFFAFLVVRYIDGSLVKVKTDEEQFEIVKAAVDKKRDQVTKTPNSRIRTGRVD